jgi:lipoprotein-releasing system permease protein
MNAPANKVATATWERQRFLAQMALRFLLQGGANESWHSLPIWRRVFLRDQWRAWGLPTVLSFFGLVVGVASLSVAMAVVSGYEATLRAAVVDLFGHIVIAKRDDAPISRERFEQKLRASFPEAWRQEIRLTPFLTLEGIIVGDGQLSGVILQGVEPKSVREVLHIEGRKVKGRFLKAEDGETAESEAVPVMVGQALAKRYNLDIDKEFRVVLPRPLERDTSGFASKVLRFKAVGWLDLGKAEFDERNIMLPIDHALRWSGVQLPIREHMQLGGWRVHLGRDARAQEAQARAGDLAATLGRNWSVMDWAEGNRNIFKAIQYERVAIFFVILVMVIAAAFNVASNIFVGVLRRTSDIATLRALGMSQLDVERMFRWQGLLFGAMGAALGLFVGALMGLAFLEIQKRFALLPADVYKLNFIGVHFSLLEALLVWTSAVLICWLASLWPARRAARLDPVEGLRYD